MGTNPSSRPMSPSACMARPSLAAFRLPSTVLLNCSIPAAGSRSPITTNAVVPIPTTAGSPDTPLIVRNAIRPKVAVVYPRDYQTPGPRACVGVRTSLTTVSSFTHPRCSDRRSSPCPAESARGLDQSASSQPARTRASYSGPGQSGSGRRPLSGRRTVRSTAIQRPSSRRRPERSGWAARVLQRSGLGWPGLCRLDC